jgi:hypothetical protein
MDAHFVPGNELPFKCKIYDVDVDTTPQYDPLKEKKLHDMTIGRKYLLVV